MTQSQHTPGPWLVQGDDIVTDGFTVGGVNIEDAEKRPEEVKANLALMANAPELLEALETLTEAYAQFLEVDEQGLDASGYEHCMLLNAYKAIKKAKGEIDA